MVYRVLTCYTMGITMHVFAVANYHSISLLQTNNGKYSLKND